MMHRARVFLLGLHLAFVHAIPIDDYNFPPGGNTPNPGSTFGNNPSPNLGNIPFLTSLLPSTLPPQAPNSFPPFPQGFSNPLPSIPALFPIVPQSEQALGVVPQNQGSFQILNSGAGVAPSASSGAGGFSYGDPSISASQVAPVAPWVFDPQDYDCADPKLPVPKLFLGCCDKTDRTVFRSAGNVAYESCVAVSQDQTKCRSAASVACCNRPLNLRRQWIASGDTQPATPEFEPISCNGVPTVKPKQNSNPPGINPQS